MSEIRPTTTVSSAKVMMEVESDVATPSCVYRDYSTVWVRWITEASGVV